MRTALRCRRLSTMGPTVETTEPSGSSNVAANAALWQQLSEAARVAFAAGGGASAKQAPGRTRSISPAIPPQLRRWLVRSIRGVPVWRAALHCGDDSGDCSDGGNNSGSEEGRGEAGRLLALGDGLARVVS